MSSFLTMTIKTTTAFLCLSAKMHPWRWFLRHMGRGLAASTSGNGGGEMHDVMRQYLAALPCPPCPHLAPRCVLHLVPSEPRTAGNIWREAMGANMIPRDVSFESFKAALMPLSPLFLAVNTSSSSRAGEDENILVSWQPWVPHDFDMCSNEAETTTSRERRKITHSDGAKAGRNTMKAELCDVVPSYFVASSLVRDQIHFRRTRALGRGSLEWQKLTDPQLAALLEWSEDHRAVRLSTRVMDCARADDLYSLKSQPELFHDALNALGLLLPTFMVSEYQVRYVYRTHFVEGNGAFHGGFGTKFFSCFPESCTLTHHPDLQFAMQRDGPGYLRLHPCFLCTNHGVPNALYESFLSSTAAAHDASPQTKEINHDHDQQEKAPKQARHIFHASLPYNSSSEEEKKILSQISKEQLLGLTCTLEEDKDQFGLTIATLHGDVMHFSGSISSCSRLGGTMRASNCGLPLEIIKALSSSQVVKITLMDSTSSMEECDSEERCVLSLIHQYLNVEAKTVCSLWKWILFVGFPTHVPSMVSVAFYRRLLSRLGVTVAPSVPAALLAAICASRVLNLHEEEGYCCHDDNNMATLQKLLSNGHLEAWRIRNLDLRIKRYGVVPPPPLPPPFTCHAHNSVDGVSQLRAHELLLQNLSALYGPEVCILNRETTKTFCSTATPIEATRVQPSNTEGGDDGGDNSNNDMEEEENREEEARGGAHASSTTTTTTTTPSCNDVDYDINEDDLLDALCQTPKFAPTEKQNTEEEEKEEEEESEGQAPRLPHERRICPEAMEGGSDTAATTITNNNDADGEEVYGSMLDGVVDASTRQTNESQQKKNNSDKETNSFHEKSQFLLSPPSAPPYREKPFRMSSRGPKPLPPTFSVPHVTTTYSRRGSGDLSRRGFSSSCFSATSRNVANEQLVQEVENEKELIRRLTSEILRESQPRNFKGYAQKEQRDENGIQDHVKELAQEFLRATRKG